MQVKAQPATQLSAENLCFRYPGQTAWLLEDFQLKMHSGEVVGLLGPSGSGKSSLLKLLAGYLPPARGQVLLDGQPLAKRGVCPVQLIHQHPEEAINPRWRLWRLVEECGPETAQLLEPLDIEPAWLNRFPHQLSAGELQRFCLLRALHPESRFVLADEISTMLDAISQAQIWQLLLEQARARNLGLLLVTHQRSLAERLCTRIIEWPTHIPLK